TLAASARVDRAVLARQTRIVSTGDPASPPVRIGSTLCGKWTLEKLLGEGGMASVYVARHKIGRLEAIKIMHPLIASSPELRARFEQEARIANRFKHPGAVDIRDIDVTEDGAPFLVMELLEGDTLSTVARRKKGPLEVAAVLRAADEVLDVLAAAHATGIIHRDIKPDNLLLTKEGYVKVLDFGIARLREGMARDVKTHTGTTLGTVAYMAPEQAKGGEIDARADLWAMGATMFRLLAGRRVHEAETEAERLAKLVSGPAPSLASVAPSIPPEVCAIVDRAVAYDRADRYPDAAAMQKDVRAARRLGKAPTAVMPAQRKPAPDEATTLVASPLVASSPASKAPTRQADGPVPSDALRTEPMAPLRLSKEPTAATKALTTVPLKTLVAQPVVSAPAPPSAPVSAPAPAPASAPPFALSPSFAPAPHPPLVAALRSRFPFAFNPANRVLVLAFLGACVLVVLLVVASVVVGLSERP
ncbi:MAG TPA: protein kinase, partial [Polyangiaceae bacterium]